MYDRAIAMKERTEHNITSCYKTAVSEYVDTRSSTEFYKTLINSIHYYTRVSTIYSDLSFVDCINLYSSLFVPEVYMRSLTEKQKHDVLSMVLRETIKTFSDQLLADYLAVIIDEHDDPTNIPLLQDCVLKQLIKHRDHSYTKFVSCEHSSKKIGVKLKTRTSVVGKAPSSGASRSQKTLNKVSSLYKKTLDDKTRLKAKYSELQLKYKSLVTQSKELQTMLLKQIKLYKDKELELTTLKQTEAGEAETALAPTAQREVTQPRAREDESPDYDGLFAVQYNE